MKLEFLKIEKIVETEKNKIIYIRHTMAKQNYGSTTLTTRLQQTLSSK